MTLVPPDEAGRAAHDSQRILPPSVAGPLYARLAADLGPGPVLDVGAGSGVVSAALVAAGSHVVLTDVMDWRAPVAAGLPFVLADAGALPYGSGALGGVHVARVLHHVPDWWAALTEAVRVLGPSGTLCLSLGDRPVADRLRELVDVAEAAAVDRGLRPARVDGPDQRSAAALLESLGLAEVAAVEFGADVPVTPREVLTGTLGNPFRWVPGEDLRSIPNLVTETLTSAGVHPDQRLLRDRTVRYRTYRRLS